MKWFVSVKFHRDKALNTQKKTQRHLNSFSVVPTRHRRSFSAFFFRKNHKRATVPRGIHDERHSLHRSFPRDENSRQFGRPLLETSSPLWKPFSRRTSVKTINQQSSWKTL